MIRMDEADHAKVSAAIAAAEGSTAGEIVVVVTDKSDAYHDVALHWSVLVLIAVLAWAAAWPAALEWWWDTLIGGWGAFGTRLATRIARVEKPGMSASLAATCSTPAQRRKLPLA